MKVQYKDYLGQLRTGIIVGTIPVNGDPECPYVFIQDDDPEYNLIRITLDGKDIKYAELRRSYDVVPIE